MTKKYEKPFPEIGLHVSQRADQFELCQTGLNVPLAIKKLNHV